jgi:DNA-binding GntR family transcriptional regulator
LSTKPRRRASTTEREDANALEGDSLAHGERPQAVFDHLQMQIMHGRIAPGTPLMEVDISDRLGVSRTPVRDALQRLHHEGLIVRPTARRPFKYTVAPMTREDARELYQIVAELDGLAARNAAVAPDKERKQLVPELRELNDALRAEAESKSPKHNALYELDHLFHQRYIDFAAGPKLVALHRLIDVQVQRYSRLYVVLLTDSISKSVIEHDAIIRALVRGDADAAQNAAQINWRNAGERLAVAIEGMGERGSW